MSREPGPVSAAGSDVRSPGPPESGGVALREMRWWHIEPVVRLERAVFPEDAWSEGMFWSELAHARGPRVTRRYLVAHAADGGLAGYGGLVAMDRTGDIQTLGVLPDHRRTGLGARLLDALLRAATEDFDCQEVLLEVRVDNAPARRLYERFGFVPVGVRRGYYQPGNIDALVLRNEHPAARPPGSVPDADRPQDVRTTTSPRAPGRAPGRAPSHTPTDHD